MRQILPPCIITSRLCEGVNVGGATLSIEFEDYTDDGRCQYRYWIYLPDGTEHTDNDLRSGCGSEPDERSMLGTLLAFLSACGESRRYGRKGENADLFPEAIGEWAEGCSDELDMIRLEIEEPEA